MSIINSNSAGIRSISIAGLDHYTRTWVGQWKRFIRAKKGQLKDSHLEHSKYWRQWHYNKTNDELNITFYVEFCVDETSKGDGRLYYPTSKIPCEMSFNDNTSIQEAKKKIYNTVKDYIDNNGIDIKDVFFGYQSYDPIRDSILS